MQRQEAKDLALLLFPYYPLTFDIYPFSLNKKRELEKLSLRFLSVIKTLKE